jgi:LL-diaminopimelate aminotransferase
MAGRTGLYDTAAGAYRDVVYMPCTAQNGFAPELPQGKAPDLIYLGFPNNPTGAVSTKEELQKLVDFALSNGCIIIFDAAYREFIRDPSLPKTIYEIKGAKKCAIEINSFSKPAGFTGVRCGWSVVPNELLFEDGTSVNRDWNRVMTTLFNGASNVAQAGALAAVSEEGLKEMKGVIDYYLENARVIKKAVEGPNFKAAGVNVFWTGNSPYLWVQFPGKKSWDVFDRILKECQVVTTPGSGFGPAGESFIRISAFGHRADVEEACARLASWEI